METDLTDSSASAQRLEGPVQVACSKGTGQGLVFTTKNGTPLRHTCASLLHEQGADARMIMEVLGHSSIRVTMDIYTFVRLDSQRSAFDRVGDALRGDGNGPDDDDGAAGARVAV